MKTWMKSVVSAIMLSMGVLIAGVAAQDNIARDYRDDDQNNDQNQNGERRYDEPLIDRYLDVQVWTDHRDGEYYDGDNIVISFMANRDAFVVLYSIDTKGRVELLFPAEPGDDNFVTGGVTYRLPSKNSNYDLKVTGPEGTENIQVIASRERIPIPDWYPNSGLSTNDDDRSDYMEYLNSRYFVRYDGQRFAYDRTAIYVDEWEPTYYRPVYYPDYPSWSVCGNVYIDYPYGGTVYINGVYWGCAPLYIPRILCGWQTVTVYDPWGYCWENDIHISRYRTVVLNRTIIHTQPNVVSKYKEVRFSGYKNPATSGYPNFTTKQKVAMGSPDVSKSGVVTKGHMVQPQKGFDNDASDNMVLPKKHLYGDGAVTKTDRGYETSGGPVSTYERKQFNEKNTSRTGKSYGSKVYTPQNDNGGTSSQGGGYKPSGSSDNNGGYQPKHKSAPSGDNNTSGNKPATKQKGNDGDNTQQAKPQQSQPQREPVHNKGNDNGGAPKGKSGSDGGSKKPGKGN